jgi:hypothetical protein
VGRATQKGDAEKPELNQENRLPSSLDLGVARNFANSNVHDQLAEQQITFPPPASSSRGGDRDHVLHGWHGLQVRRATVGDRPGSGEDVQLDVHTTTPRERATV